MRSIEEIEKRHEAIDMIMDLLAESGDKQMICASKANKLTNKLNKLTLTTNKLNDEKYEGLTNIIEQFDKAIDDFLRE